MLLNRELKQLANAAARSRQSNKVPYMLAPCFLRKEPQVSLRLSTGFCHGLQLKEPAEGTRPTAGRVRSAVMNSLQARLPGARVLDLFAGSGAVGIEALSREASSVTFIENNREALKALEQNLAEVQKRAAKQGIKIQSRILAEDAARALRRCQAQDFDIIWLDPPYSQVEELLASIGPLLKGLLHPGGLLVIESDVGSQDYLRELFRGEALEHVKQKIYGRVSINFFQHAEDEAEQ